MSMKIKYNKNEIKIVADKEYLSYQGIFVEPRKEYYLFRISVPEGVIDKITSEFGRIEVSSMKETQRGTFIPSDWNVLNIILKAFLYSEFDEKTAEKLFEYVDKKSLGEYVVDLLMNEYFEKSRQYAKEPRKGNLVYTKKQARKLFKSLM